MRRAIVFLNILLVISIIFAIFIYSTDIESRPEKSYYENYKNNYKIFNPPIPNKIDFAGEKTPLNIFHIAEKYEREILVNTYWHSNTLLLLKRANRWFPVIESILKKNNIPDDFKYLALIESGLTQAISPVGARGFWQFMKTTGIEYNLEINKEVDERYHVEKSTQAACEYLQDSYEKFGSWTAVAASYNVGRGGLNKQLKLQKMKSYYDLSLNSETSRYLFRILAIKTIFSKPSKYGFQLREKDLYPPLDVYTVNIDSTYINWADFAIANEISYRTLKELNPWLKTSSLHNSSAKKYTIKLPNKSMMDYQKLKDNMSDKVGVFGDEK